MRQEQRRTLNRSLRWVELSLFAVAIVLAAWCAVVLVEARYYRHMPVPPPSSAAAPTSALPGDSGDTKTPAPPPPAPGAWVARLEAPTVAMTTTVLEGSDDATLAKAAGHIEETAFPGETGNIGIAGHRDTIFRPVRNLKVGDPLVVTTADRVFNYRISSTIIVGPDDVYVLDPTPKPTLTLVTCWPFTYVGHAPKRYIVHADLVEEQRR